MADPRTVIEGCLKYRDFRKWKSRWCVVSKLSPVADCLHLQFYRDSKDRCKNGSTKASLSLDGFLGMESGFTLDKESNTLTLICSEMVVILAFESRELLIQWQVKIRANICEEQQFLVQISHVPPKSKLTCGPARLHLQDHRFCLVAGVPPRLLGVWPLKELRRFGVVDGKFCFEGGSRCGKGEGLHVLLSNQGEDLVTAFDFASKGKLTPKRKNNRKSIGCEMSSRISLASQSSHRGSNQVSSTRCSSESCRPLLSSGSEGSGCDACSEIMAALPSHDHLSYKWPSSVSSHAESCRTADDASTADFQGSLLRRSIFSSGMASQAGSQMNWFSGHCSNCGRHTMRSTTSMSYKTRSRSPSPDIQLDNSGFTPQWTMDFQEVPAVPHVRAPVPKPPKKSPADRDSLCSQSSHSSGSSSMSSNSSEYSVPKNNAETMYDHPRSVCHRLSARTAMRTHDLEKTIPESPKVSPDLCSSCSSKNVIVPRVPVCACWNRMNAIHRGGSEVDFARACSGETSPKKDVNRTPDDVRHVTLNRTPDDVRHATLNRTPDDVRHMACPCDGGQNPYAHYAVPRSVLATNCLKSPSDSLPRKMEGGDRTWPRTLQGTISNPAEEYDVPKKFKEKMSLSPAGLPCVGYPRPCFCTTPFPALPGELRCAQDSFQPCGCQKVMLWAGSLVPCWGSADDTATSDPPSTKLTVCTEPAKQCSCDAKRTVYHNYVNVEVAAKDAVPNYANLHFVQTLPLYENAAGLLSRLETSPKRESSDCIRPPLPPRSSTLPEDKSPQRLGSLSNTTSGAYELMSFQPDAITGDDNYLVMQPLCVRPSNKGQSRGDLQEESKLSHSLPLRPFMPYLLPCGNSEGHGLSKEMRTGSLGNVRSPITPRSLLGEELLHKSLRSNSLEGLKRKVLMKKRSCSAENRQKSETANDMSEPEDNVEPGSPKSNNNAKQRKNSLFSKLSLRTKEKSYSTDEISPPSSEPSSPSNTKSFENLHRLPFHHSADCLKQKEEYGSEEDIPSNVLSEAPDFKYNLKIKRSCSVPCKPKDKPMSSTSDSACASDNSSSSGKVNLTEKQYLISEHLIDSGSSPTEIIHLAQPPLTPRRKIVDDQEKNINTDERPLNQGCPKLESVTKEPKLPLCVPAVLDASRNTGSTSSSDMSDYIETLSLCSRTSSGSGSSSDYIRFEELSVLTGTAHSNNQCLNTMRPRFGKEYHSIDRNFLQEKQKDLEAEADDQLSKDLRNNLNSFVAAKPFPTKSGSPSPGYVSSSPSTGDCNCSNLFQFPKSTKELNYLEMEMSEPVCHNTKPEGVQYAVIDVLATEAAKKLSCERANSRNESTDNNFQAD